MSTGVYLLDLAVRLGEGLERLPADMRARHAAYLQASQNADGGFSGREGGSDLYYTGFALRGLAVLDALSADVCRRAAGYLKRSLAQQASVVDFFSLLSACFLLQAAGTDVLGESRADWPDRAAEALESFRTPDGGYARQAGGAAGSVYHTFLVVQGYQLLGKAPPAPEQVRAFIRSRQREDGGFVEIAAMRRSGTNPTAAAVGVLQVLGDGDRPEGMHPDVRARVVEFLAALPSPEGGLRGNGRAPAADLLSTFTGLWTLDQLGALGRIDREAARRYALALERPGGGFRGGLWDDGADVEYTFYGLGCLALLAPRS